MVDRHLEGASFRGAAPAARRTSETIVTLDQFGTLNAPYVQALYEEYLRDPAAVDPAWRELFENGVTGLPVTEAPPAPSSPSAQDPPGPDTASPAAPGVDATLVPLRGAAQYLVKNMTESLGVPTATSFRELPVSVLEARRREYNTALTARRDARKISFTHLIGYAIVRAVHDVPVMTHAFREIAEQAHRVMPGGVNLGLAVDVEKSDGSRALMVPVIRGAESLGFAEFHSRYEELVAGARTSRLLPDAYQGATITLTNPGTIGTRASVPRLMAGQGTIVATGAISYPTAYRDTPPESLATLGVGKVMMVSSTYDHRIIQGAESGLFLRRLEALLQGADGFYEEIGAVLEVPVSQGAQRAAPEAGEAVAAAGAVPESGPPPAESAVGVTLQHVAAAMSLVKAFRSVGHRAARLDPLGSEPPGDPALDPESLGLTPEIMAAIPASVLRIFAPGATLAEALPHLRQTYCGTMAYEIEHIADHAERVWMRQQIESGVHRAPLAAEAQRKLLRRLIEVEALEVFLHRQYLGHKRFGIEGLDVLVPMLELAIEEGAQHGTRKVVIGMAHRGRLNVLAHVVGLPYDTIIAEFEGGRKVEETLAPAGGTGDVKYHHGAEGTYTTTAGRPITVALSPNPSHLEAVDPIVVGRARAEQTLGRGREAVRDEWAALPVLIHGDAAFAAQGVVAETFNLERLDGYRVGGTVHLIANNQIGFTTEPSEARSTELASDLAKGFDIPIFHVNADDPEAALAALRLAMSYRHTFGGDIVIDLVGYRRHGHNEGDEPAYTQPRMYAHIAELPSAPEQYGARLAEAGVVTADEIARWTEEAQARLAASQEGVRASRADAAPVHEPQRITVATIPLDEPETAVPPELLQVLNGQLLTWPAAFQVHPKLLRQLERRRTAVTDGVGVDWAHAETLAFASLLTEGVPIRLVGQDTIRGTFSQRHLALSDVETGHRHIPMQHLPGALAPFEVHNSPLSEFAALGFEYGYSVAAPETLVLWEAQFGDFVNGAAVVIDQFVIAGLAKWGQTSRLVLLLPHGYEGQGPEHSSARIERFLALGAEENIRVANCTTPAQYFHLLRRQAKHVELRPLVVFTPKSLLRLPLAQSDLGELTTGAFRPVLDDPGAQTRRADITRLVLCSGKVYYDLVAAEGRQAATHVAIGRLELLYPFPAVPLGELITSYPSLREIVWVQEEPTNMGARKWVAPQLQVLAGADKLVRSVTRPERSSPAEGYPAAHRIQQQALIDEALA